MVVGHWIHQQVVTAVVRAGRLMAELVLNEYMVQVVVNAVESHLGEIPEEAIR